MAPPTQAVPRKTSHRKCLLCIFHDYDPDPVEQQLGREDVLMFRGKPIGLGGETVGNYCFYCVKIYNGRFRGIRGMTIIKYTNECGQEDKVHQKNLAMQKLVIKHIVERGGARHLHINWEALEVKRRLKDPALLSGA